MANVRETFLLSNGEPLTCSELLAAFIAALVLAVLLILVTQIVFALKQGATMGQVEETTVGEAAEELETQPSTD